MSTSAVEIALADPMTGARLTVSGDRVSQMVDAESSASGLLSELPERVRRAAQIGERPAAIESISSPQIFSSAHR